MDLTNSVKQSRLKTQHLLFKMFGNWTYIYNGNTLEKTRHIITGGLNVKCRQNIWKIV